MKFPPEFAILLDVSVCQIAGNMIVIIRNRGKVNRAGFSSKYFGSPNDSILVIFNDLYYVSHYANQPNNLSTKYLLFSSNRNIGNPLSYDYEYWDIDKYARRTKYTYTFTEDDYDFAKIKL